MHNINYINHLNLLLHIFSLIGVIACAISGTLRAVDSKMDITGAILLAFIVSNAGGTIRDMILGAPIFWIKDNSYVWLSTTVGGLVFIMIYFNDKILSHQTLNKLLILTDSIGLAIFCLVGVEKAVLYNQHILIVILLGVWTAVGGGVIADVIANRVPLVFSSELYITVAFFGAVLYINLSTIFIQEVAGFIAVSCMIILRILSVKYHLKLPIIKT